MSNPITWRNVDAPSFGEANRMMLAAQSGINSGFNQLGDVLKNEQATADANWKTVRDNNTQAFLNSINQYRTPEEYQAALTSGALDPSKFGAQIDQAAARSALDGRMSVLQDRMVKANQIADMQQERDARPIMDRLSAMALSEDKDVRRSAKEALGIYAQNGMVPKAAELTGQMRNIDHQNVTWNQDNVRFEREGKKLDSDLLTAATQRRVNVANAGHIDALTARENAAASAESKGGAKESAAALASLVKGGVMSMGVIGTKEGDDNVMEWINKNLQGAQKEDAIYNFNKRKADGAVVGEDDAGKPIKAPIPAQVMINALGSSTENPLAMIVPGWSRRGDDADNNLLTLMRNPALLREIDAVNRAQNNDMYPGLMAAAARAERTAAKNSLTAGGAFLPPSAVEANTRLRGNSLVTGNDSPNYSERPNPNLNNPIWLADQRRKATEKNAKLPDEIKRRLGITN